MGKYRESDDEMDVELPCPPKKIKQPALKQRGIHKVNKVRKAVSSGGNAMGLMKKIAKMVKGGGIKKEEEKQAVFTKIVDGLRAGKDKLSKKEKKKQRAIIKHQLREALEVEHIRKKSEEIAVEPMVEESKIHISKREKFDQEKEISQFKGRMGTSLSGLKEMLRGRHQC